jgi:hypothetical protein
LLDRGLASDHLGVPASSHSGRSEE